MLSNRTLPLFLLSSLLVFGGLGSCTEENPKPKNLIPEDTYVNLLVDLQLLEAYRSSFHPDSVNIDSLKDVVFEEYQINQEQFVNSHTYYQRQPTLQKRRISQALDTLQQQMVKEGMIDSTKAERLRKR